MPYYASVTGHNAFNPMNPKVILLIGQEFLTYKNKISAYVAPEICCYFSKNGIRGLAQAIVRKPNIIICENNIRFLTLSEIKFKLETELKRENVEFFEATSKTIFQILDSLNTNEQFSTTDT